MMTTHPVIQEIHGIREEYSKSFGDDLKVIGDDARNQQGCDDHRVVSASPKLIGSFTPGADRLNGLQQNPVLNQPAVNLLSNFFNFNL